MKESTIAYIGLGANLGDREAALAKALDALEELPGTSVLSVSEFRETEPVGYQDQPDFLNAVASVETTASARALLAQMLELEARLGRDRATALPGGPRTIDLDLLLFGAETIDEEGLQIPHPRMHERRFVLEPLAEIAPRGLEIPGRGPVSALLAGLE